MQFVRRLGLLEFLLFVALAVVTTWPLAREMDRAVPLGTESVATVPLLNVWTMWWNADRATAGYDGYWDAPIFYPTEKALAFSEAQPLSLVVAPITWLTGSRLLSYNVFALLALAMNAWSVFMLLRCIGLHWTVAFLTGLMIGTMPFAHWRLGVIQLVPICGIVWTIHASWWFSMKPTIWRGLTVGAAFASTYFLCNYYGLFLSALLIPSGIWLLGRRTLEWRAWLRLLAGVAFAGLLLLPMVVVQRSLSHEHEWDRSEKSIRNLSAEWTDYSATPYDRLGLPHWAGEKRGKKWPLGPGYAALILALVGLVFGVFRKQWRRWTIFLATFMTFALLLSLGLKLTIGSWSPYQTLMKVYPGFALIRSPYRFAVFVQLATLLLAAGGLQAAISLAERWKMKRPLAYVFTGLLAIGTIASTWPEPTGLYEVPHHQGDQAWVEWLRNNTDPTAAIVHIPFVEGYAVERYLQTSLEMYWGSFHGRPMTNGYSGYFPEQFQDLREKMPAFPDEATIGMLREREIKYCVVVQSRDLRNKLELWPDDLHRVFIDENRGETPIVIYEILPPRQSAGDPVEAENQWWQTPSQ